MAIRLTDEQLGARLSNILNRNQSPRRNERGLVIQRDGDGTYQVVFITDQYFDLAKAAREFRDLIEQINAKPPRKKAQRG